MVDKPVYIYSRVLLQVLDCKMDRNVTALPARRARTGGNGASYIHCGLTLMATSNSDKSPLDSDADTEMPEMYVTSRSVDDAREDSQ